MEYIIIVDYSTDAERKRIDYAIERWKDRAEIEKPRGAVLRYSGDTPDEFLDDLYSRLNAGKDGVTVFNGDRYDAQIPEKIKKLRYATNLKIPTVEKFITYIMKKTGAQQSECKDGVTTYRVGTKKGYAVIEIAINPQKTVFIEETSPAEFINGKNNIVITVRGYGDVVSFISEGIDAEIQMFLKA